VAFHIDTPDHANSDQNVASKTMVECLDEDTSHNQTSVVPDISGAESTALSNNSLLEVVESVRLPRGGSNAQRQARVDARHAELVTEQQTALRAKYQFWGFDRTIP
jgi:hypothetical protein